MRWSEIALVLLAAAAVAGFFIVVTGSQPVSGTVPREEEEELQPLDLLERDLAALCYGDGFRPVPAATGDTLVRSMDLLDSIPPRQANLHFSRILREHGFQHRITYSVPGMGLSFHCATPDGEPLRLELMTQSR